MPSREADWPWAACRQGFRAVTLLLAAASALLAPQAARADAGRDAAPSIETLRVGFGGHYKTGYWAPVEITVRGGARELAGHLVVTVPDGDDVPSQAVSEAAPIAPGQLTTFSVYVKFGRADGDLRAALSCDGELLARRTFRSGAGLPRGLPSQQRMILVLGPAVGVEEAASMFAPDRSVGISVVPLSGPAELPSRWLGYDGVDALVVSGGWTSSGSPEASRLDALGEWLEMGGRMLLVASAEAEQAIAPGGPLASFVPGRLGKKARLPRTTALEMYIGSAYQVPGSRQAGGAGRIEVHQLDRVDGVVELSEGNLPLVLRTARVFGEVTFVALDLARGPLAEWQGRGSLVAKLLWPRTEPADDDEDGRSRGPAGYLGLTDLAGQLRGALEQFQGIAVVPFWGVALSAFIYLLLVGPVDFFVLKKLGRLEWTWFTFPLLAAAFSLGAWALAHRWKGDEIRVNQVDLVDVDLASGRMRGTTWLNMFSPRQTTYDLSLVPLAGRASDAGTDDSQTVLAWHGLPGSALGGMETTAAAAAPIAKAYRFSPGLDQLLGVPVGIWSTKSFTARWSQPSPLDLEADLTATADLVAEGTLTSRLPMPLTDCMLLSGPWAYVIGDLKPGQRVRIIPGEHRELVPVFKEYKLSRGEKGHFLASATPYDQAGFDVAAIMRQMLFFEAARGRSYTGLLHRYQHFIDLSGHLSMGRAVLVGQAEQPASQLQRDGRPLDARRRNSTFYRFVLPMGSKPAVDFGTAP